MRARSFLAVVGLFALAGCGGGGSTSGISVASGPRDLGGFIVPSQSSSTDAATSPVVDAGVTAPDLSTPTGGGGTSCGSVTAGGDCNGTTLEYCDPVAGLQTEDCSAQGLTCAVSSGTADCVTPSSGGGGCGSIDTNGICQGNTLEYCTSSGTLKTKNCSSSGESCSVSSSGYASCK